MPFVSSCLVGLRCSSFLVFITFAALLSPRAARADWHNWGGDACIGGGPYTNYPIVGNPHAFVSDR
jgi:hypothetical protein